MVGGGRRRRRDPAARPYPRDSEEEQLPPRHAPRAVRKPSHSLGESPTVEEMHVYGEHSGPTSIPLPTDFEWVALTPEETTAYRDLRLLNADLDFAIGVLERIQTNRPARDLIGEDRDSERDDFRARWNAALVAYARVFAHGMRARLDPTIFDPDARTLHQYFMRLRNRHVAHSVSDYERIGVLVALEPGDEPRSDGILDYVTTEQLPGATRTEGLQRLARIARRHVSTRLDAERQLLHSYSRGKVAELARRPRLTRIAEPIYTDELKPRVR